MTPQQIQIILMHITGWRGTEIAHSLSISSATVSRTIHSAACTAILDKWRGQADKELESLMPLSVERMRDALRHPDPDVYLRAVDKVLKARGKYREPAKLGFGAEDAMQKILERHQQLNVQIVQTQIINNGVPNGSTSDQSGEGDDSGFGRDRADSGLRLVAG